MDWLYLPYLKSADTLSVALEKMQETNSRAIVVHHNNNEYHNNEHRLYMNDEVVDAVIEEATYCGELQRERGQLIGTIIESLDATVNDELYLYNVIEKIFDKQAIVYALPFLPAESQTVVLLVTSHENRAAVIRTAPKKGMCPDKHKFTSPPSPESGTCNIDGKQYKCY